MSNDEPTNERCNAQTRDGGYCANYPVHDADRCRMHGGANSGPPKGSANALTHGATASPFNLVRHLSDDDLDWIDRIVQAYVDDAGWGDEHPELEDLRFLVILMWQRWSATDVLLSEGQSEDATIGVSEAGAPIIRTEEHHLSGRQLSLSREIRQGLTRLGFSNTADDRTADATETLAEMLSSDGTGDRDE